jgi:hypothetical protein
MILVDKSLKIIAGDKSHTMITIYEMSESIPNIFISDQRNKLNT